MSRTNIVLGLLLGIVVVLTALSRIDYGRPNIEVLPDMMKYSPAYHSYEANRNFANDRTLQAPVPGTIARGEMPIYYQATPEDALRAGEELRNPYEVAKTVQPVSDATNGAAQESDHGSSTNGETESMAQQELAQSVQRGVEVYRVFCIPCHGPRGAGDGPVAKRGFPPPPSLLTGKSVQMKDGQLFHILTYGQTNMPQMASQLTRAQRWDVINYVRELQASAPPAAGSSAEDVTEAESEATVDETLDRAPSELENDEEEGNQDAT